MSATPLNPLHVCTAARLLYGDLKEIDRQLSTSAELNIHWIVLVKHALICVANLVDLERRSRQIYRRHPEVSKEFKKWNEKFDFAKYMRNIFVGHTDIRLVAKAIEWKPELLSLLRDNRIEATFLVNFFLLETAINTYVDGNEQHLVFDSDTDLTYPENWTRFLIFLTEIVRGGLDFLSTLINAVQAELTPVPEAAELIALYIQAGQTTFSRL